MLDSNKKLLDSIMILPLSQIVAICDAPDEEGAHDFLKWLYDSIATSEEDYTEDIESHDDVADMMMLMAIEYEPSDDTNSYQERLERRREYYDGLAAKRMAESDNEWAQSHRMGSVIPFGQPILVGHHSEKRDRRFRDKIWNKMGQAVKLAETAKYHAARAARVGSGGISGDDPNKIIKLRRKMAQAQHLQKLMKAANKVIKSRSKSHTDEAKIIALHAMGFSHTDAVTLMTPDYAGRIGFAAFQLSNNSTEIRRIADRITEEEANVAAANTPDATYTMPNGDVVRVEYNDEDNRIRFHFPREPDEEVKKTIQHRGYIWSPFNMAWQRKMTANARSSVPYLVKELGMIAA